MNDWTNAVKAGVIAAVNAATTLILATLVFLNVTVDLDKFALLSVAVEGFVNTLLGLWILLTYRNSPTRASASVLKAKGLTP